jgi:arginyl-tRNA synthetase
MSIRAEVGRRAATALTAAGIPADISSQVQWANRPDHGDMKINADLPAAKALGRNPRELAQEIVTHLDLSDLAERVEIAGPGFINIFLKNSWLSAQLAEFAQSDGKGVEKAPVAQTVVVFLYSPNLA